MNINNDNTKGFVVIFNSSLVEPLKDLLVIALGSKQIIIEDNNIICLLKDKESIEIKEYLGSMSEDIGARISAFRLLKISTKNDLNTIKKLVYDCNIKNEYSSLSDLIIYYSDNKEVKEYLKDLVIKANDSKEIFDLAKAMFQENLNVSKTANRLYMHRNTLNNKIDNIERNCGLSLREFKDCVAIYELMK